MYDSLSLVKRLSLVPLRLVTLLTGTFVGRDERGNRYYRSRSKSHDSQEKRWVLYSGDPEPTKIPPDYFAWMHKIQDRPLLKEGVSRYQGKRKHIPNLTGTNVATFPKAFLPSIYALNKETELAKPTRFWRPAE